jgi:hypothetical protein
MFPEQRTLRPHRGFNKDWLYKLGSILGLHWFKLVTLNHIELVKRDGYGDNDIN